MTTTIGSIKGKCSECGREGYVFPRIRLMSWEWAVEPVCILHVQSNYVHVLGRVGESVTVIATLPALFEEPDDGKKV